MSLIGSCEAKLLRLNLESVWIRSLSLGVKCFTADFERRWNLGTVLDIFRMCCWWWWLQFLLKPAGVASEVAAFIWKISPLTCSVEANCSAYSETHFLLSFKLHVTNVCIWLKLKWMQSTDIIWLLSSFTVVLFTVFSPFEPFCTDCQLLVWPVLQQQTLIILFSFYMDKVLIKPAQTR